MTEGHRIDPVDWDAFEADLHDITHRCVERLRAARDTPWIAPPADMADRVKITGAGQATGPLFDRVFTDIVPHATGNTHPRFYGWVHGTGTATGVAAEMVAATMNANMGGRDQGGAYVERAVIDWLHGVAGWPDGSGLMTSGTSQATILALSCARMRAFPQVRAKGLAGLPEMRVYIAKGGHSCVKKALEVMGHGADATHQVAAPNGVMDVEALRAAIAQDRAAGLHPLVVVGTVGSVNLGTYDDLNAVADVARDEDLWLHCDAAFGFWSRLADAPWRDLSAGIEQADSVAMDFHKWMAVPYAAGAVLIRDEDLHLKTFRERPEYLAAGGAGLAGGAWWATDYGLELSRGFTALKVWATVEGIGTKALGAQITDNCKQAAYMGELAEASDVLDLAAPVVSNLCVIRPARGKATDLAARLQIDGDAVFSTTMVEGVSCLRAAIVNHRTTRADVVASVAALGAAVRAVD
ncbi:pyridoxal phosphate-dependent decarboxylase family protein [Jannaschia donghaensis]|uniref:L-2,4-diaminobutyrate decarboxylase n=1 Tax=Jannaschia donghaensis TaxID=420998 RepID=A0A0M6YFA1_9RHOB|nr:pyridoxal-dependent decarboxylase [Jannaschia donghaensis]CTQ48630.1 L-2,4-diaminobutyrate decarboxylase [Jannaschia donghaensis]